MKSVAVSNGTKDAPVSLSLTLPDGTTKAQVFERKITVGEVKRTLLQGTSYNCDDYRLKIENNILAEEGAEFRRSETLIVKALLRGDPIGLTLEKNTKQLLKKPTIPNLSTNNPPFSFNKQPSTTSNTVSSVISSSSSNSNNSKSTNTNPSTTPSFSSSSSPRDKSPRDKTPRDRQALPSPHPSTSTSTPTSASSTTTTTSSVVSSSSSNVTTSEAPLGSPKQTSNAFVASRHRGSPTPSQTADSNSFFQTRRVTISALEKQKSPRGAQTPDLLPPKRLITIGSRQASGQNITKSSSASNVALPPSSPHSSDTSYAPSPMNRSPRPEGSTASALRTLKTVNRRLFDDSVPGGESPVRIAIVVFPVRLQLWNGQQIILNCSSGYSAQSFIEHVLARVTTRITSVESTEDLSKFELEVGGTPLGPDEILAKNPIIADCLSTGSSIPTALLRMQGKPFVRSSGKPSGPPLNKVSEFQVLVVLPTGQTVIHKCKDNFTLHRLKKEVIDKAHDREIDLSPERYSFATWNEGVIPKLPVVLSAAVTSQLTIFKDDSVTLESLTFIKINLKRCITPKFLLIPKRNFTFSEAELERQVAVKALIGRPLLVSDDNDEIFTLRRTMAKIRAINRKVKQNNFSRAQARVSVRIVKNDIPKTNVDLFVVLVLPLNEVKKTVHVKDTEIADEFLAKIFVKYYQKKVPHKKPTDFVLKAAGLAEYIDGAFPLNTFEYIRSRVAKNLRIELVVVERPQRQDEDLMDNDSQSFAEDLSEDTTIRYIDTEVSVDGKQYWDQMTCISLWDMDRSFRLKLVGVENLSIYYNNLKQLMTKTDSFEDGRLYFYVTAGIYHGGSLLVPIVFSQMVPMSSNPRWYQWFNFAIKMKDLPRAARVCFTLYARPPKGEGSRDVPIGWVNCQLFNFKHELRTGTISLNMYRDDKANPIGTCVPNAISNAATLFVEFDSYKLPVVFPTDTSEPPEDPQEIARKANDVPANVEELNFLMSKDPLYPYSDTQRELIWQNRYYFLSHPKTLPKVLASVKSSDRLAVQEMKRLLDVWVPLPPIEALELLDSRFTEAKIREHAVEWIDVLPDEELIDYLLQLVQVLKYEPYHDSALARFLVRRALWSSRVGHSLFWYLKSEMHVQEISERYGLLLEAYLFGSGRFLVELKKQDDLMSKLVTAANSIKAPVKESERKDTLLEHLRKIEFPSKVSLPLNPSLEANGIMVDSCKYMDSKKLPLWVVLRNSDPNGSPIYIIFKSGDDLRQDMLTLQMIRIMDKLWKKEGLDLQMSPYGCISTGDEVGMIEVVLNADTTASISKRAGGATAAFYVDPLAKWLQKHNPESQYEKAVEVFIRSCAGYCVATYVLGIGDRHNDNIMVTKSGRLFHIDFGHFLGNYKKKFGFKRERAPFVLTPDFAFVMGGETSPNFKKFIDYCCTAYNILRQHAHKFINLFAMMLSTGIPELTCVEDINYLRNAFTLDYTEEEAREHFTKLIYESLSTKTTQLNNAIHILAH